MSRTLRDALLGIPDAFEREVREAVARHERPLREAVRAEMELRFARGNVKGEDPVRRVPVSVEAAIPRCLEEAQFPEEDVLALLLAPHAEALRQFARRADDLDAALHEPLRLQVGPDGPPGAARRFREAAEFARRLLLLACREDGPVPRILAFDEDVLGIYEFVPPGGLFPNDPFEGRVVLYWRVIAIVANVFELSTESITGVVLAHELAHAYSHLGLDIDDRRWPTLGMARSDRHVVEGLAQYYTHRALRRFPGTHGGMFTAFSELWPKQAAPYRIHAEWVRRYSPEAVRRAFTELRRGGEIRLATFEKALDEAATALAPEEGGRP